MTAEELKELNDFCATDVMEWELHDRNTACYVRKGNRVGMMSRAEWIKSEWRPTTDSAQAMEVQKKCAAKCFGIQITITPRGWRVNSVHFERKKKSIVEYGETLELAICLFARQLFGKEKK